MMFANFKTAIFATALAIVGAFLPASSQAAFVYTSNATLNVNYNNNANLGPIANVKIVSETGGQIYTNTYQANGDGTFNVRSVGMIPISVIDNGSNLTGIKGPTGAGTTRQLLIAFAIQGKTAIGSPLHVDYTSGGYGVYQQPASLTAGNPSTWINGITGSAGVAATKTALNLAQVYAATWTGALPIIDSAGTGSGNFIAADVDASAPNQAGKTNIQYTLLFNETKNPVSGGNPFLQVAGQPLNQTFEIVSGSGVQRPTTNLSTNSQNLVNALSSLYLGTNFATSFSIGTAAGVAGAFSPNSTTGTNHQQIATGLSLGDYESTIGGVTYYGGPVPPVPEPSSIVLLGSGMMIAGLYARRRKSASKA